MTWEIKFLYGMPHDEKPMDFNRPNFFSAGAILFNVKSLRVKLNVGGSGFHLACVSRKRSYRS